MLTFDREIETIFLRDRSAARSRQAYLAGLIAVLSFNAMVCGEYACGEFAASAHEGVPRRAPHRHIPCLLGCYAVRRGVSMTWLEALMAVGYGLGTVGAVVINQNIRGDAAIYDAFTNVLILICCNIALPMAFLTAVIGSAVQRRRADRERFPPFGLSLASPGRAHRALYPLRGDEPRGELSLRIGSAHQLSLLSARARQKRGHSARQRALSHLSRTDVLTGLPNRRDFDERLAAAVVRSRGEGRSLATLVLDIDNFKLYNDVMDIPRETSVSGG